MLPQSCEPRSSSLEWRESVSGVFGGVCEKCDALLRAAASMPARNDGFVFPWFLLGGCPQLHQPGQVTPALQLLTLRTECKHR